MRYPVLIEEGSKTLAFGVVFVDLSGCSSAGDALYDALEAAKEAAVGWVDAPLDAGTAIPSPAKLEDVRRLPGYKGRTLGVVELDPSLFDDSVEPVSIALPRRVLRRVDGLAASRHQSRGAFIADLSMRTPDGRSQQTSIDPVDPRPRQSTRPGDCLLGQVPQKV